MNERIQELMIKCNYVVDGTCDTTREQKFAELLIKECCLRIEREYKYAVGEKTQWDMSQDVQDLLKAHFEIVEE